MLMEKLLKRYVQVQREIARLELEKEHLRNALVKELEGKVPPKWRSIIDDEAMIVVHGYRTKVSYDESLLKQRLGGRYNEILEIDGAKIRKNRDIVRPLLEPILARVGTPAASRVESSIRNGLLKLEEFKGAFTKTQTPYISIRGEKSHLKSGV